VAPNLGGLAPSKLPNAPANNAPKADGKGNKGGGGENNGKGNKKDK
jgi:hypothetical protein